MVEFSATRVVVVALAAAIGLAACGGSSAPRVASLGTGATNGASRSASGPATTQADGNPTQLLDEWATCMRRHGDPDQADPTVDANKVIHIPWSNPSIPGGIYGTNKGGQGNSGPGQYCRSYLNGAQNALRGGPLPHLNPVRLLRFSECMHANGIPDFPDPTGTSLSIPVNGRGDLNPANPTFRRASELCAHRTGVPAFGSGATQPGMIELSGAGPGPAGG